MEREKGQWITKDWSKECITLSQIHFVNEDSNVIQVTFSAFSEF